MESPRKVGTGDSRRIVGAAALFALISLAVWLGAGVLERRALAAGDGATAEERPGAVRLVRWGGCGAWMLAIAVATTLLLRRERRRVEAEEALRANVAQLQRSQRLEALGCIAGGLAHDINNYLGAIRGHCELVRMKLPSGDRSIRKMTAAIRAVEKTTALIDRLLAFGRMREGNPVVVDLNRVIAGLDRMMRPTVGEAIKIVERLTDGLWTVKIDLSQLEQIIVNLIMNARDAMPDGGVIRIETKNVPGHESGGRRPSVLLVVTDTGCGIAPELTDKIFDPFWTTKASGNSGLGLATVYAAVRQNGGSIEVQSEVGKGTSFRIFLPRSRAPASGEFGDDTTGRIDLLGSEAILLVDDSLEFREATASLLEALGYRVRTAGDGEEAYELFHANETGFDLVLTDVVMPRLSGPELVARLRREGEVKAVFMSGHSEDVARRHGVAEGEIHFLKNQFSKTLLATAVREALDRT